MRHGWDALAFNIFINDLGEGKNSPLIILRAMLNWELWLAPKEGPLREPGRKYWLARRRPKASRKSIQHPPGRDPAVYILSRATQGIHKSTRRINFPLEKVAQVVRYRQAMAGKGRDQTKK